MTDRLITSYLLTEIKGGLTELKGGGLTQFKGGGSLRTSSLRRTCQRLKLKKNMNHKAALFVAC